MESGINLTKTGIKFGGLFVSDLAKKYSTPLYVFCEKRVSDNYSAFQKGIRKYYKDSHVFFSIKTNSEKQVLSTLQKAGSNAEAASGLEVKIALKAGFKPEQIIIDGPAWPDEEIDFCIKKGIRTFNVDSVDLLKRVNKIAKKNKKIVNVSYRIFPEMKMLILKGFVEGFISKFGIPLSQAVEAYKYAMELSNVNPTSISAHIGSMITDPSYYEREVDVLTDLAAKLKKELDLDIKEINIGGGYGVESLNYYSIQSAILEKAGVSKYHKAPSIDEFAKVIGTKFKQKVEQLNLTKTKLILEPGRFIVSDAGILLTKVVAVKNNWVFLDGGINLIPESIFFIRRGFLVDQKFNATADHTYNIAGPSLNTVDVLASKQKFPEIEVGDVVVVLDSGAYSLSRSNQFTFLRPAAIYIHSSGKVKYLRKAEDQDEFISKMI